MTGTIPWTLAELEAFPKPPSLVDMTKGLQMPDRPLVISLPCCGIMGSRPAFKALGVKTKTVNVYDLDNAYESLLRELLAEEGGEQELHLGAVDGDMSKVPLGSLQMSDLHVVGPPCPPWAGNGKRGSTTDRRADVYEANLRWILHQIDCGALKACMLENVLGIMHGQGLLEPYLPKVLKILKKRAPSFHWDIVTLEAKNYSLAQCRTRVFLRGLRKDFADEMPPPLGPVETPPLRSFLNPSLPNLKREDLTPTLRQHLRDYERRIRCMKKQGTVTTQVVIATLDRDVESNYSQVVVDRAPTQKTGNLYQLVVSTEDIEKPSGERAFFRMLHPAERMALQGFDPCICKNLSPAKAVKAAGNAYPPPLILAALAPLLDAIAKKGPLPPLVGGTRIPHPDTAAFKVPPLCHVKGKAMKAKKQKAMKAKAKAKAKVVAKKSKAMKA